MTPAGVLVGAALDLARAPARAPPKRGRDHNEPHCGACHGLELPRSQRLDRAGWEWVMADMVEVYGMDWLTEEERGRILDYLVSEHGPAGPGGPGR
ncbi:MAG: hypothetical protein ACYDA8_05920 [Deferrisomatales bacterium]